MSREVDVFLEGVEAPVGRLSGDDQGSLVFRYSPNAARPLSLALPLREEPYGDVGARAFFDNLLQENASLEDVMARHGIDRSDIAGLLYHLGKDCPGAISCVPAGEGPGKRPGRLDEDYDELPAEALSAIMTSLRDNRRLPPETRDPSPLAGIQGKIALALLPDGRFALPRQGSGVPTTHIIKVPRGGEEALVDQEDRLMRAARETGLIDVATVAPIDVLGVRGLLITRFDREIVDGAVRRIHQEDFCQALGLPVRLKYERNGQGDRIFDAAAIARVLDHARTPARARQDFLRMTLLNLALGNTDNHAKNHALIYRGNAPELAPLYDVVPVLMDRKVIHDFAFRFGSAGRMEDLVAEDLLDFARAIGIRARGKAGEEQVRVLATETIGAIAGEIAGFRGVSMKVLGDMVARQTRVLTEAFGLEVEIPERDAFLPLGGGWNLPS